MNYLYKQEDAMDKKTKKIVIGCFVGGTVCTGVAMLVAPMFWLIGLIAGIAAGLTAGYIGYDFMAIVRAIPIAWKKTIASLRAICAWFNKLLGWRPNKLRFANAFWGGILMANIILDMGSSIIGGCCLFKSSLDRTDAIVAFSGLFALLLIILPLTIAFTEYTSSVPPTPEEIEKRKRMARRSILPILLALLVYNLAKFLLWAIPRIPHGTMITLHVIGKAGALMARAIPLFFWNLFLLIHRKERTICAIDGAIGGVLSFIYIAPLAQTMPQQLLAIAFGGLIGIGLGVLNYELVTKRWLIPRGYLNSTR